MKFEKLRALWQEGSHCQKILEFGGVSTFPSLVCTHWK